MPQRPEFPVRGSDAGRGPAPADRAAAVRVPEPTTGSSCSLPSSFSCVSSFFSSSSSCSFCPSFGSYSAYATTAGVSEPQPSGPAAAEPGPESDSESAELEPAALIEQSDLSSYYPFIFYFYFLPTSRWFACVEPWRTLLLFCMHSTPPLPPSPLSPLPFPVFHPSPFYGSKRKTCEGL